MNRQHIAVEINDTDLQAQVELPDETREGYYMLTLVFENKSVVQKIVIH